MMKIEKHGIEAIPKAERNKHWWDLFTIQAGIAFSFPTMVIGSLLVPGLNWSQAVRVNLLGNAIVAVLVALMGSYGVDHGLSTTVASRFTLGHPLGTRLCSILLLISLVGWYAVVNEFAGLAVDGIVKNAFGFSAPALFIILVGAVNAIPAIWGFEEIKFLNRLAVPALAFLALWILKAILAQHKFAQLIAAHRTGALTFSTGLDWIVGGYIVGVFIAPDYARYTRGQADNWMGSLLGVLPPALFLGIVGVMSRLATGDQNPVTSVQTLGLGVSGLLLTMLSTIPSGEASLYSAGLALTNVFPQRARWKNTLVVTILGAALAVFGITKHLGAFLTWLSYAFSPLVGVSLCDYFILRGRRLFVEDAYMEESGEGRSLLRGLNGAAMGAIVIGIAAGVALSPGFPASLTSLVVGALIYYPLAIWSRAAVSIRTPVKKPVNCPLDGSQ